MNARDEGAVRAARENSMSDEPLLSVEGLAVDFATMDGVVHAPFTRLPRPGAGGGRHHGVDYTVQFSFKVALTTALRPCTNAPVLAVPGGWWPVAGDTCMATAGAGKPSLRASMRIRTA